MIETGSGSGLESPQTARGLDLKMEKKSGPAQREKRRREAQDIIRASVM